MDERIFAGTTTDFEINENNIELFGHTNLPLIEGEPVGIAVNFHGLGDDVQFNDYDNFDRLCAAHNIIRLFPYYDPWSWMNRSGTRLTDTLMSLLRKIAGKKLPVVTMGDSMGGCAAISYTYLGCSEPIACAANSPVCDLVYHYSERRDLPRTMYAAFGGEDRPLREAIEAASPMHNIGKLPDIPFYIVHGTADSDVSLEKHSAPFAKAAADRGLETELRVIDGMRHCDMPGEEWEKYFDFIIGSIENAVKYAD